MKIKYGVSIGGTLLLVVAWLLWLGGGTASASHCTGGPSVCGQNSGLVPFHKDAITASLIWAKTKTQCPKMLIWMRPSEYKPRDYLNPTQNDPMGNPMFSGYNEKYIELVQGGFNLSDTLDRSGWSRYAPDLDRENTQLIDVCGLQALIDTGAFTEKTKIPDLTDTDISLTDPFFQDAGYSKGLNYNIFCPGHEEGIDGRIYVLGTHDKGGNNGGRKVNIFDPKTEQWIPRPTPCVRSQWEADPTGTFPHCDPLEKDPLDPLGYEINTDPPHPSDMKYQRWYQTTVALPDGRILSISGTDQDTSVGGTGASVTKVRQRVPEVYDPKTDRNVALENARKLLPMYVRSFVVQTGPGKKDWKVAVLAEVDPPLPGQPGDPCVLDRTCPNIRGYDPFHYIGNTYLLDVQAALADPKINEPAENHWTYVDRALNAHEGAASAIIVRIKADGTWSQEVFSFGGSNGTGAASVATVEKINFSDPAPAWQKLKDDLILPADQNNVVILPDGKLLVVGGRGAGVNTLHYQMFDPADGSRIDLIASPVPRHDHSTALVVPNGGVWVMGGNRVQLIPGGDVNRAIPVMEFYRPPYFFKGPRPIIEKAPHKLRYGKTFVLRVTGGEIGSVAILRTGPITHNWTWGNRYVQLPFEAGNGGRLDVMAPPLPGLAIAGDYLLFVVNKDGVPSEGKHIRLRLSDGAAEDEDDEDDD